MRKPPAPLPHAPSRDDAPDQPPATKREAILDAATRVFLAHGFEGASMDLVAKEAGAARRTVYNQFESKEVLFIAAVQRVWRRFPIVEITSDPAALLDPALGLRRLGQAIVDFWAPPLAIAFVRMVISEGAQFPDLPHKFMEVGKAPAMRALIGYLVMLHDAGRLHVPDPELAAHQFLGLLNEQLLWGRVIGLGEAPSDTERGRVVDAALTMFLDHYAVKPLSQ